ncbi:MAG: hypothetical protein WKG07_08450 [Hymenobacter sp.]
MGLLRFGATMDEVRTLVGEPEEIEESEDEDEFRAPGLELPRGGLPALALLRPRGRLPPELHRDGQPRPTPLRRG